MALIFHERVGLDGRRISPFSSRIRYALAHKDLAPEVLATRFADVGRIRERSGQDLVPIIEDDGRVVHDSWAIACYLEDHFPDRPSLFDGAAGRGAARFVNTWSGMVLAMKLRRLIAADFVWCLDPGDRAYYRRTRETQFGMTLEAYSADRAALLPGFIEACAPLEQTLSAQPFLAGELPAYVDYTVFSAFQWARVGSPTDVLPEEMTGTTAMRAWRARMVALFGGLGDRFALYPANRNGLDGRETQ
jgi:glutathione S-transferase